MTDRVTASDHPDPNGVFLRRAATFVAGGVVVALLAAGLLAERNAYAHRAGGPGRTLPLEKKYVIENELTLKADLAEKLPYTPRVIILGGSRSLRFEPEYIKQKTGLSAFNAGVRNGRPEEAWGLIHYLHDLWPDVRPRYLWLVHVKLLRGWWRVQPPLVQDKRFNRYFPPKFLEEQGTRMPDSAADLPAMGKLPPPRWAPDGHIVWSHSDTLRLATGIRVTINQWFKKNGPGTPTIERRPRIWFARTLDYMNRDLDATPVLVLMPVQPDVLEKIGPGGFWDAHKQLTEYLRSLRDKYRFKLVDLTHIESFGGDPENFYDGYHPKAENTRRIIDEVLRRYPHAFD
jgi:hypothetical protein